MANTITLGGKVFTPVKAGNSTVLFDYWAMNLIQSTGIDLIKQLPGEAPEDFMVRLHAQGVKYYSQMLEMIAGMMLPQGIDSIAWTPKIAEENLAFIATLQDKADKQKITEQFQALLLGFFQKGLSSLKISPKSSGVGPMVEAGETEAASTTERGAS